MMTPGPAQAARDVNDRADIPNPRRPQRRCNHDVVGGGPGERRNSDPVALGKLTNHVLLGLTPRAKLQSTPHSASAASYSKGALSASAIVSPPLRDLRAV